MSNSEGSPIFWVSFPDGISVNEINIPETEACQTNFIENIISFLSFNSSKAGYRF